MKTSISRRVVLAVALVGAAFLAAVVVLALAIQELRNRADASREAERTLATVSYTQALIVDVETAIRGFALTRQESFLSPLRTAEAELPGALSSLTRRASKDPEQAARAATIAGDSRSYLRDYAQPLVEELRASPERGLSRIRTAAGKRRVDAIRAAADRFDDTLDAQTSELERAVETDARRALGLAAGVALLAGLLLAALVIFLRRSVVAPIRRASTAATALSRGDLSVRLPAGRSDEIGELGRAFNTMAVAIDRGKQSLDAQNAELESQNAELEHQAVELESQASELEAQAVELEAGQHELSVSNAELIERTRALQRAGDRLVAEGERAQHLAALKRAVLDATGDAIHMFGLDGKTLLINRSMERFARDVLGVLTPTTGSSPEEIAEVIVGRMADPDAYRAQLAEVFADPEHESVFHYELADSGRCVSRYTAPVRAADGSLIGRIFVLRETTEERAAQRLKDELMATVSHELRTPLAAIVGFTELLIERDYDEAQRRQHLGTIHNQAERLSALINDFLDLQRLEHSQFGMTLTPVDLRELLEHQVTLFSGQSERHAVRLEVDGEDLIVSGEPERLGRAVANLITNAIKYSPDGGPVIVSAGCTDDGVRVAVTDHGIGIPEEAREHMFQRFFRVDNSATTRIGGTGLGLALVREIAEAHGGSAGYESTEGTGSTFWITVPSE